MRFVVGLLLASLSLPCLAFKHETLTYGRFGKVALYRPDGEVKSVALFLSGDGGWNLGVVSMAQRLAAGGALVAGINIVHYLKQLEDSGEGCVYPDGDLENLAHFLEAYVKLPTYRQPIVVGYSSGATLAYAALAQSPDGTFAGALSLGFCPDLDLHKPLCKGDGVRFVKRKDGHGVDFLPVKKLPAKWAVLQGDIDKVCDPPSTRAYVNAVGNSELVWLPHVGHGFSVERHWMPQFLAAYQKLTLTGVPALPPPPASLGDLPVIEVPAPAPRGDLFALLLSGDGGWAGLDKQVAAALAADGIPVVGLDSLRYFWSARTPQGTAADVDRIVRYYLGRWNKRRVILLGYSQGADVLSFVLNRLSAEVKSRLALGVLMALSERAVFEFHLSNWLGTGEDGLPTRPEMARLPPGLALCIYGEDENDSLCPALDPKRVKIAKLPGSHHFGGDYEALAQVILNALPKAPAVR